jgi:glycosyltransferase involved in cell wall biosynthesis
MPPVARHRLRLLQDGLRSVGEAPRLLAEIRSFAPDAIITRRSDFDRTLDKLIARVDCPVVAEVNEVHHSEWRLMLGEAMPAGQIKREIAYYRRADLNICVSGEIEQELLALGVEPTHCAVVPNGADCELFNPDATWDEALKEWVASGNGPLVAFCGTGSLVHDIDTLLAAAQLLAERVPETRFLFVGPLRADVESLIKRAPHLISRVFVTGPVPQAKVPALLAPAQLLWASYRAAYVSPLKILEYMAMGRPVVAAGAGQVRELLEVSRSGIAVDIGRPQDLADAAVQVLRLPQDTRRALGSSAREWAVEKGSWSAAAATMLALVREKALGTLPGA